jgi:hypothetical protein
VRDDRGGQVIGMNRGPDGRRPEIACDESGYEGEKLVGGETDVFAHASVLLADDEAADCIAELRRRIRSPAQEYKANHLLREKHRPVLLWLLGADGPIRGRARVHLVDKTFLLVTRVAELVGADPDGLYREGRRLGDDRWTAFLATANDVLRSTHRQTGEPGVDAFYAAADALRAAVPPDDVLALLPLARPRLEAILARQRGEPRAAPALDPLTPAIVRTVVSWSDDEGPVSLVHDRQTSLTRARIARITALLGEPARLAGLRFVGSRSDPRVQIADFLAGVARKVASHELDGRGDAELVALLRTYVDPASIWGDDRSWSALRPR